MSVSPDVSMKWKMIFPPYMTVFKWQIFLETCINCLCEVYHFSFEKINLFLLRNLLNVGLRNQISTLLCLVLTFFYKCLFHNDFMLDNWLTHGNMEHGLCIGHEAWCTVRKQQHFNELLIRKCSLFLWMYRALDWIAELDNTAPPKKCRVESCQLQSDRHKSWNPANWVCYIFLVQ